MQPILLDQGAYLAFRLNKADVVKYLLARLNRSRRPANHREGLQHVQQDPGIVAAGMTEHIEGGAEQLTKGNRVRRSQR